MTNQLVQHKIDVDNSKCFIKQRFYKAISLKTPDFVKFQKFSTDDFGEMSNIISSELKLMYGGMPI